VSTFIIRNVSGIVLTSLLTIGTCGLAEAVPSEIHGAVKRGDLIRVQELLKKEPGLVNTSVLETTSGWTPLHAAAQEGHKEIVDFLLSKGAAVNAETGHCFPGITPLHAAVRRNQFNVIPSLMRGASEHNVFRAIKRAASTEYVQDKVMATLLNENQNVDINKKILRDLAHQAALVGNNDVVKVLLEKGAVEDIFILLSLGKNDRIEQLIKSNGSVVNDRDWIERTPLAWAVFTGNLAAVKLLLSHNVDVNASNVNGRTPLFSAVVQDRKNIVEVLLANGARLDIVLAIHLGRIDNIKTMLQKDPSLANWRQRPGSRWTPLTLAAKLGKEDIAMLLIENGADVNAKGGYYNVEPLFYAVKYGFTDILRLLISHGADVNVDAGNGQTPLNWAELQGHQQVVALLRKHGAQ